MRCRTGPRIWMLVGLLLMGLASSVGCDGGDSDDPDAAVAEDQGSVESDGKEEATATPPDVVTGKDSADPKDVCKPDCGGRDCGDDGCGGSCGDCWTLEGAINNDLCTPEGTCPVCGCGTKVCGFDPCGSTCGQCRADYTCNDQGTCDPPPIACDQKGFVGVLQHAKLKGAPGAFYVHYQSLSSEVTPLDALVIEIDNNAPMSGPKGPGTYDLKFLNFGKGGLWSYILVGWNGTGYSKLLIPTAGQLVISTLDPQGGPIQAKLVGAVFEEASFDKNTQDVIFNQSPNAMIWCVDEYGLDTDLNVTQPFCVKDGTGAEIGDNIKDFKLQNCNGDWVRLQTGCGKVKALWIVATAGW
ncbi:MAG: hypothetical protein FJ109_11860 [Deltaproteobacteria bacterium]|nr:hypothetical protein [Deltaproteobacteria bacterium]